MGLFDWFNPNEEERTIGEISNDAGDHVVFDVPAKREGTVKKIMREGGIEADQDDRLLHVYGGRRQIENRDPHQHRYRMERVVNPTEDLEDSHDRENDTSDSEFSEQSPSWWPFR